MGASKRSVEDQFKALRREARTLQTPADAPSAEDDSDVVNEEDLNVYQRAKRGLPPRGTRQNRGSQAAAKSDGGVEKAAERSRKSLPAQEAGVEEEAEPSIDRMQQKRPRDDSEEEEGGEEDDMTGGATKTTANTGSPAIVA